MLPPADDQPARLVIDVVPTSREAFLEVERRLPRRPEPASESAKRDRAIVARRSAESGKSDRRASIPAMAASIPAPAAATGVLEKDVTLEFAEMLASKLEATGRYNRCLYREPTTFRRSWRSCRDRAAAMERDLFVSIHANSFRGRSSAAPSSTRSPTTPPTRSASEIAARENRSDMPGRPRPRRRDSDEVLDILFDLTRRETRNFAILLREDPRRRTSRQTTGMFKVPLPDGAASRC